MSDSKGPCQTFITSRLDIAKLNKKRNGQKQFSALTNLEIMA